jgi:GT2 family glycosyltransferase
MNVPEQVLVITVNCNGSNATLRLLASVTGLRRVADVHLIVVDNASADGSLDQVRQRVSEFSNMELLESSSNRGYLPGAAWALQQYLENTCTPDWVIVCNNDILFSDELFFERLFARRGL